MTSDITTTDPVAAQKLWDALREAGVDAMPRTLAHVEEALFRCYLPLARTMARRHTPDGDDHQDTAQAAEVGLAQAILAWRHSDSSGFEVFARQAINSQLRRRDTSSNGSSSGREPSQHGAPDPAPGPMNHGQVPSPTPWARHLAPRGVFTPIGGVPCAQ